MEKEKQKQKSMNEILPLELIQLILLRVPARHLGCLRCVSKLWQSLISDPHFAESHLHHSPASTHAYLFIENYHKTYFYYLEALFNDYNEDASEVRVVPPTFKKQPTPNFTVLLSCRGFLLLHRQSDPTFLVVFNPLTGDVSETISCSHIFSHLNKSKSVPLLYGFGYDASQDDYLLVVAWNDDHNQDRFHCFSLRSNSWIHLDFVLPTPLGEVAQRRGLFLNGAIHWVSYRISPCSNDILVFDMKERTFSTISAPKQVAATRTGLDLILLGGCLALFFHDQGKTNIWVMKEYKVHSSWTLCVVPCNNFKPLYLSNNGDIVGLHEIQDDEKLIRFLIYNVLGELLKCYKFLDTNFNIATSDVYTESFLPLPTSDLKDMDKKKKKINVTFV